MSSPGFEFSDESESSPLLQQDNGIPSSSNDEVFITNAGLIIAKSLNSLISSEIAETNSRQNDTAQNYCHSCAREKKCGMICQNKHFICTNDCFSILVLQLCDSPTGLRVGKGRVTCPKFGCTSEPWTSVEVRIGLHGHDGAVDKYTDALLTIIGDMEESTNAPEFRVDLSDDIDRIKTFVCASLILVCPNPSCRGAIREEVVTKRVHRCEHCGCHFCWLCLTLISLESGHRYTCSENDVPSSSNITKEIQIFAHKKRRMEAIRRELLLVAGNSWPTSKLCMDAVEAAGESLSEFLITKAEIFDGTTLAPTDQIAEANIANLPAALACNRVLRLSFIVALTLIFTALGVVANFINADVLSFSQDMYKSIFNFLAECSVTLAFMITCLQTAGQGMCLRILLSLVAGFVAFAVSVIASANLLWFCEGTFFALDSSLAFVTGGSVLGDDVWQMGQGLVPRLTGGVVTPLGGNCVVLAVVLGLRYLWLPQLQVPHHWLQSESIFFTTILMILMFMLLVAISYEMG